MTTATLTAPTTETATVIRSVGRYTIEHDACDDGFSFHVIDETGNVYASLASEDEAVAEATEAEATELRDEAMDLLADCEDIETLKRVLKALQG